MALMASLCAVCQKEVITNLPRHPLSKIKPWDAIFLCQVLLFTLALWLTGRLVVQDFSLGGDYDSYILFPFSSLTEALSSHRTFGLPLLILIYKSLFEGFALWPYFQVGIYLAAVLYLYTTLNNKTFTSAAAFIVCSGLLWNPAVFSNFKYLETHVLVATFHLLTIALLLRVVITGNYKAFIWLGICVFFLYQTRPNMAIFVFLIPLWGYAALRLLCNVGHKKSLMQGAKLVALCFIPLLIFCSLRWILVGNFGMASFSGTVLSGQATGYLNQTHLSSLEGKTKLLAENILERKRALGPVQTKMWDQESPCNLTRIPLADADRCEGAYINIAWLAAIQLEHHRQPFNDDEKNKMPWLHTNLSGFFSGNNVVVDKSLGQFAWSIIAMERQAYFERLSYELKKAVRFYARLPFDHSVYLLAVLLALLMYGMTKYTSGRKFHSDDQQFNDIGKQNRELGLFFVITMSTMVVGVLSIAGLVHVQPRYMTQFALTLLSTLLLYALPHPRLYEHLFKHNAD